MTAGARRGEAPIGEVFHGTTGAFGALDPQATPDDGIHFGSIAQARTRAGPRGRVIAARLSVARVLRTKDAGGTWRRKVLDARRRGYDAIVYLNRWEGVTPASTLRASEGGVDLGALSDAEFRRRVPEATDSWIVFDASCIRGARPEPLRGGAPTRANPPRSASGDGGLSEARFAAAVRREYRKRRAELAPVLNAAPERAQRTPRSFVAWVRRTIPDAFDRALAGAWGRPRRPRTVTPVQPLDELQRLVWHGTTNVDAILLDGLRLRPAVDVGRGGKKGWGWSSGYSWRGPAWEWFQGLTDEGRASLARQAGREIDGAADLGQAVSLLFVMTRAPIFAQGYTTTYRDGVSSAPGPVLELDTSRLPVLGYFEDPYVMGGAVVLVLPARGYQGGPDAVVALRKP